MSCGIYKITNKQNGKIYIGQSIKIEDRWNEHLRESLISEEKWKENKRGEQTHLHRAMRQYQTKENIQQYFEFTIIEHCEEDRLNEREIYWVSQYNSYENGYNMTRGGDGHRTTSEDSPGAKLTLEQVKFIKEKLKANYKLKDIAQELDMPISLTCISDINTGKTWYDPTETYPLYKKYGCNLWTDEKAMAIREKWANGATITELAKEHQVDYNRISELVHGKTYTHLPITTRQVSYQRINKDARLFTEEQVLLWRNKVYIEKQSIQSVWKESQAKCCYAAFYNMIKGKTYQNYGGLPDAKI